MAQLDQKKIDELMKTHVSLLSRSLVAMRIKEKADVTIICGEKEFFAHRCILEAASLYFKTMLSCGLQESTSDTITFKSTKPETLEAILDFIYTGKVDHINSEELLNSVLIASHLMQLKTLFWYCSQALIRLVSTDNFFELFDIGRIFELEDWQRTLISYWVVNSSKLIDNDKFLALEIVQVKELLNFVKSKCQCLDVMLAGFLNWLRYDLKSREVFIDEFFDCIDEKLVKQQFVQSWLKDKTIMALCGEFAKRVEKLSIAVLMSDSQPPSESIILDVCSWKTKLTYFSQFRTVEVFDSSTKSYTVPRSESKFCVQQFDLSIMEWLPLQIPESANLFDFRHMYQFGEVIHMINQTHTGSYEIRKNCLKIEKLRKILPLGESLTTFKGHVYTNYDKHICCSKLGECDWNIGSTLNFSPNKSVLLASTDYLHIIGDNPDSSEELTIQYNSRPCDECSDWKTIRIIKGKLQPSDFFVYNDTLNAIIGFAKSPTMMERLHRGILGRLQMLTYNHSTKKMEVTIHETPQEGKVSYFQDCRCPYIFFAESNDNFSIPVYAWQPVSGVWTKLPPRNGKCEIPNDSSVKLIYSIDK